MNNVTIACIGIASFALFTGIRITIENRRREKDRAITRMIKNYPNPYAQKK